MARLTSLILVAGLMLTGCAGGPKELGPAHNEILFYSLPYDLTYLRTMEALERVPGWELDVTEKEKGTISVRNINYSSLNDADKRLATFIVRRVNRNQSSVQLAPDSVQVVGGGELLEKVANYLSQEINS